MNNEPNTAAVAKSTENQPSLVKLTITEHPRQVGACAIHLGKIYLGWIDQHGRVWTTRNGNLPPTKDQGLASALVALPEGAITKEEAIRAIREQAHIE